MAKKAKLPDLSRKPEILTRIVILFGILSKIQFVCQTIQGLGVDKEEDGDTTASLGLELSSEHP